MAHARRSKVKDPAKAFISTWRTSTVYTGSTADNQIKLPLEVAGTYRFTVNWGDNTSNLITVWNQAETTHTYPAPGDYTVTITGFIKGWDWGGGGTVAPTTGDMRKLLTITQFGCLRLVTHATSLAIWGTFFGCTNLTLSGVQDTPNFKGTTSNMGFLRACSALTTVNNVNKWDVSKITFFRNVFRECTLFNDNVGNWNTSNAYLIAYMFAASGFNNGGSDSIKNWDVSNVLDMSGTFLGVGNSFNGAGVFNQPIGSWNTSKVISTTTMFSGAGQFNQDIGQWDMSKVTNSSYMLQAVNFNNGGSPSINNWDVSKVTTMSRMFQGAFNFNQPINNWKVPLVTDFVNFMNEGGYTTPYAFSVTNYSNFLIALAAQPLKPNVSLRVYQYYDSTALAARAILLAAPNNWTFVDRGLQP